MVSNIRYRTFKDLEMKGRVPFVTLIIIVAFFVAIALDPSEVLFLVFFVYVLSGLVLALFRFKKKNKLEVVDG